jgi:hypothetical protein
MKKLLTSLTFILFSMSSFTQVKTTHKNPIPEHDKVLIGPIGSLTDSLFIERPNVIVVASIPNSKNKNLNSTSSEPTFILTSSQGTVSLYDKNMFLIDGLKNGKVIFTVFKIIDS